jgi:hypothetical protein
MKLPAEILPPHDVEALLATFGSSGTDVRNYAIVSLAYRVGLKIGDILALERRHFQPRAHSLVVPARARAVEREVLLDAGTREALERWMTVRKRIGVRATAPLLCTITQGAAGNPVGGSYIREMLKDKARIAGIDRRVTAEGLRHSGKVHRQHSQWRMESQVGRYLDQEAFRLRYPEASEKWQSALDLYAVNPQRHATVIGHACRDALLAFSDAALRARRLKPKAGVGPTDKLRTVIKSAATSRRIGAHGEALLAYWGTTYDLANRQTHGASREKEALRAEDARRLIFHTMIVMFEVDRLLTDQ